MFSPLTCYSRIALVVWAATSLLGAEELRVQPTPFSAWLDFRGLRLQQTAREGLPIWIESLQVVHSAKEAGAEETTIFRIRLRQVGSLNAQFHCRTFFFDRPGASPMVSGWSETGVKRYQSEALGAGLNVPTSAALMIPAEGLDYLDISVAGDGADVRGAFVATLAKSKRFDAVDFSENNELGNAFDSIGSLSTNTQDSSLYGRVKATLATDVVKLDLINQGITSWEFELDARSLLAVATFEIHGADPLHPPEVFLNGRLLGAVALRLPDLADPAYEAVTTPESVETGFQYGGWIQGQRVIPGTALRVGLNKLVLRVDKRSGPLAVRGVELQLKHHWQHLEYRTPP